VKRYLTDAVAAAAGALLVLGALAPAAHAAQVTNPADHPSPITVKGDDGNTYSDGQDTLPGYDDYECTYIPGAWFDFANNRVRYADGQSIPWTEWDRATGYKAWLANHTSSPSPTKSSTPTPKASATKSAPSSGTTSSSAKASGASAAATTSAPGVPNSASATGSASADAVAGSAGATPGATSTAATVEGSTEQATAGSTLASSSSSDGRGAVGVLILVGLAVLGALILSASWLRGRLARKGAPS
jgi:hypothetical protein